MQSKQARGMKPLASAERERDGAGLRRRSGHPLMRWALVVLSAVLCCLMSCAGDGAGVVTGGVDTSKQQAALSGDDGGLSGDGGGIEPLGAVGG